MLGMSYFFYEVQRSGRVPSSTRAPWRGDTLKKASGGSLDGKYEGGYFDAGDHVIFQLPQAYSIARLTWTAHAFSDGFDGTYFDVRKHCSPHGAGRSQRWATGWLSSRCLARVRAPHLRRRESLTASGQRRRPSGALTSLPAASNPTASCCTSATSPRTTTTSAAVKTTRKLIATSSSATQVRRRPAHARSLMSHGPRRRRLRGNRARRSPGECSDVTGEMAAALAHAAVAFKDDQALSDAYWAKAQLAYLQTGAVSGTFGTSHDVFDLLKTYYYSSGTVSHVFFAAASMYTACKALGCPDEASYLADANTLAIMPEADGGEKWYWPVPGWDNAWCARPSARLHLGASTSALRPRHRSFAAAKQRAPTTGALIVAAKVTRALCPGEGHHELHRVSRPTLSRYICTCRCHSCSSHVRRFACSRHELRAGGTARSSWRRPASPALSSTGSLPSLNS